MSDLMLHGILNAPCEAGDIAGVAQLKDAAKRASAELTNKEKENAELKELLMSTYFLSTRIVIPALTLAKHDYPLSPSASIQLTDWKAHESKIKKKLNMGES